MTGRIDQRLHVWIGCGLSKHPTNARSIFHFPRYACPAYLIRLRKEFADSCEPTLHEFNYLQ